MSWLLLLLLAAAPEWKLHQTVEQIAIYSRELPGERVVELKLVTTSALGVKPLCDAAFGPKVLDPAEPDITLRRLIREGPGEQVTCEQISPPVVADRDYAVRSVQQQLPSGACRVTFSAANELAPKLPPGFVRIEKLRGSWELEPAGAQTQVTYVIFTDPGGSIPAALIEGSRRRTAVAWMKLVLERAKRNKP